MQTRRLGGVAVLAAAVLVLSVGTALGRPDVVGTAAAPPIDPPPQVGDCLYGGPDGPWGSVGAGGEYLENPYGRWFAPCRDAWFGEVVAIRSRADITAELSTASTYGPGSDDPCTIGASEYLGRPDYGDPDGLWIAGGAGSGRLMPNARQYADGQMWEACVAPPLPWTADGDPIVYAPDQPPPRSTESLRGAWTDGAVRDRLGTCGDAHRWPPTSVFCGAPHGTETMAWTSWPGNTVRIGGGSADVLLTSCAAQAARMLERSDPTAGGALAVQVWMQDPSGYLPVTSGTELPEGGFAECAISPASPDRQLTASLVGIGEAPLPLTPA